MEIDITVISISKVIHRFNEKTAEKNFSTGKMVYFVSLNTIYSKSSFIEYQNMQILKIEIWLIPVEMWKNLEKSIHS